MIDHLLDFLIDPKNLEHALSSSESFVPALFTSGSVHEISGFGLIFAYSENSQLAGIGFVRFLAILTNGTNEPLRQSRPEGSGNQERLDPHVDQPRYGAGGVVGVQSAENHMPGQGGVDGDLRSFKVTNFPHHYDVRSLPEHGSQSG